jgi:hypothetical protein
VEDQEAAGHDQRKARDMLQGDGSRKAKVMKTFDRTSSAMGVREGPTELIDGGTNRLLLIGGSLIAHGTDLHMRGLLDGQRDLSVGRRFDADGEQPQEHRHDGDARSQNTVHSF